MNNFKDMRCRIPFTKMTAKWVAHGERWLRGRGSCKHSSKVDTKLLKKFFSLMRDMEDWNSDYQKWIKNNEQHKKDRYLIH